MSTPTHTPIRLPDWAWTRNDIRQALRERDVASIFQFAQQFGGASQGRIASATGILQGRVSEIMTSGRRVTALDVFERVADGLNMPNAARALLGLAPIDGGDRTGPSPWDEVMCAFPSQAAAVAEIQSVAAVATSVEVVAVRGLGIVGLNDSLLRSTFLQSGAAENRRFRIFLLDPTCRAAQTRASEIGETAESFASGIRMTIASLQDLASESEVVIEVYQYQMLPIWRLICLDETMYVSVFGDRAEGHASPVYKIGHVDSGALSQGFRRFCRDLRQTSERIH